MRGRRTDLALEARELWEESTQKETQLQGVEAWEDVREGFPVSVVKILDARGSRALGKPVGRYVTLTLSGLLRREEDSFPGAVTALRDELRILLNAVPPEGCVLVAGLGNQAITPDAIGPKAQRHTLITRHLVSGLPAYFGHFRPVAALAPGVLGTTGMESGELLQSICRDLKPVCVIAVDALASRSLERLCRTVQLSDSGIAPGSGVGNHRLALDAQTLGIPVIAIGVPTVVDAGTLAADLLGLKEVPELSPERELLVTPKDIDSQVSDLSRVIGYGISLALQPELELRDLELLLA